MTIPQDQEQMLQEEVNGWWNAEVDITRTPSPGIPSKRMKMFLDDIAQEFPETALWKEDNYANLLKVGQGPESLDYSSTDSFEDLWATLENNSDTMVAYGDAIGFENIDLTAQKVSPRKRKMQTGCIPCL